MRRSCRLKFQSKTGRIHASVLQVDSHLFPGNRQLKVWRPRHPQIDRRVRVVVEHLHANLCTRTSVADLARSVNMSRWRFCHLFKIEMSQSPSHYSITVRTGTRSYLNGPQARSSKDSAARCEKSSRFSTLFATGCSLGQVERPLGAPVSRSTVPLPSRWTDRPHTT